MKKARYLIDLPAGLGRGDIEFDVPLPSEAEMKDPDLAAYIVQSEQYPDYRDYPCYPVCVATTSVDKNVYQCGDVFGFYDEAGLWYGSLFETIEQAEFALNQYVLWLEAEPTQP